MKREEAEAIKKRALEYYDKAHIVLTKEEKEKLEVADMGLNDFEKIGLVLLTYVNTQLCCAKEMVLFPHQTCPEHIHAPIKEINYIGKEETFRCRYGKVYLYVAGEPTPNPVCKVPKGYENCFTVWHQIELNPGEQYTLVPNTWHWFQSGDDGAVISEFSTASHDEHDLFTDKNIKRMPKVEE